MDLSSQPFAILITLILIKEVVFSTLILTPVNQVLQDGDRLSLNCGSDQSSALLQWGNFADDGTNLQPITTGTNTLNTNFSLQTSPCDSPLQTCAYLQLIAPVTSGYGNRYRCANVNVPETNSRSAFVVVLNGDPWMTDNIPSVESTILEGDNITIFCSVSYGFQGSAQEQELMQPLIRWTGPDGEIAGISQPVFGSLANSSISFSATRNDQGATFNCTTYFNNTNPSFTYTYAKNTPNYIYTIQSQSLDVSYPPGEVNITLPRSVGNGSNTTMYNAGEELICWSDSRPPAHYEWIDLLTNNTYSGQIYTIPQPAFDGEYYELVCVASNVINGDTFTAESDAVEFGVLSGPSTTAINQPTTNVYTTAKMDVPSGGLSSGAIIGIVFGSIILVCLIAMLIFFLCVKSPRLCKRNTVESTPTSQVLGEGATETTKASNVNDVGGREEIDAQEGIHDTRGEVDGPPPYSSVEPAPHNIPTTVHVSGGETSESGPYANSVSK